MMSSPTSAVRADPRPPTSSPPLVELHNLWTQKIALGTQAQMETREASELNAGQK